MARFRVLRRVDAFVDYFTEVEAESPDAAAARVAADETRFDWAKAGVVQFDARLFVAVDDDGDEIESSQHGDFC
jgi:hypothetical protein